MNKIADVAQAAGVSISTVSKVMNDRGGISESTRAKVLAVIERMNYHSDFAAKGLRTKKTMMLGTLVRYLENEYFQRIVAGIEDAAYARGYNVVICNCQLSAERERTLLKLFLHRRVDGLIFVLPLMKDAELVQLAAKDVYMAVVGAPIVGDLRAPLVSGDHEGAGYNATMHLIQIHGKRRIAYIQGPPEQNHGFLGYCRALADGGLPFLPELVGYAHTNPERAGLALEKIIYLGQKPDAVFCFNDELALGVYRQAAKMGLRIPDDLAVIGVDNTRFGQCLTPSLTSVAVPTFEMGQLAANELIDVLESGVRPVDTKVLPTKLIARGSCGCPDNA